MRSIHVEEVRDRLRELLTANKEEKTDVNPSYR
jgi:hypothetical protein